MLQGSFAQVADSQKITQARAKRAPLCGSATSEASTRSRSEHLPENERSEFSSIGERSELVMSQPNLLGRNINPHPRHQRRSVERLADAGMELVIEGQLISFGLNFHGVILYARAGF